MLKLTSITKTVQSKDIQLFETFSKNYRNSLKSILIYADFDLNETITNTLMKQIFYLKNFNYLQLLVEFDENSVQEFVENLKAIAINCNQLNDFRFCVLPTNQILSKQIFKCLSLSNIS
jgi:hypothetical protein